MSRRLPWRGPGVVFVGVVFVGVVFVGVVFVSMVVGRLLVDRAGGGPRPLGERPTTTPAPAPFAHHAYVWQRAWTPALRAAVGDAPAALTTLRVLAHEVEGPPGARAPRVDVAVDLDALVRAGRDVVAVLRVGGAALGSDDGSDDGSDAGVDRAVDEAFAALVATAGRWRGAGVRVVGVEVDHDSATAGLPAYARWLTARRALLGGGARLSITALPSWATGDGDRLRDLVAAVDDVVLQVHAIRAPRLFDPAEAAGFVGHFVDVARRPVLVAVPTYRVTLADGATAGAEPADVAPFVRALRDGTIAAARVEGAAWFRLGHDGDRDAWGPATLRAVLAVAGAPAGEAHEPRAALRPRLGVALVPVPGDSRPAPDGGDVVVTNDGLVDADAPAQIAITGAPVFVDGVRGYVVGAGGHTLGARHPPRLRPGESVVVGVVRGVSVGVGVGVGVVGADEATRGR